MTPTPNHIALTPEVIGIAILIALACIPAARCLWALIRDWETL